MTFLHLTANVHIRTLYILLAALGVLCGGIPLLANGPLIGLQTEQVGRAALGDLLQVTRMTLTTPTGVVPITCTGSASVVGTVGGADGHTLIYGRFRGVLVYEGEAFVSTDEDIFYLVLDTWGEPIAVDQFGAWGDDIPIRATVAERGFRIEAFTGSRAANGSRGLTALLLDRWGASVAENPVIIRDEKPSNDHIEDDSDDGETEDPEG